MTIKVNDDQHDNTIASLLDELIEKVTDSIEKCKNLPETSEIDFASKLESLNLSNEINQSKPIEENVVDQNNFFAVKWITFNNHKVPIILQNINGPCPLISICNVLLLRDQMHLSNNVEIISNEILIQKLADLLFTEFVPRLQKSSAKSVINFEQIISDSLSIFSKLQYGLDVNVKFTGVKDFEYTREMDIFDIFGINLYHGWLIDPEQQEFYQYLADKSYNQLVEITVCSNENFNSETTTVKLLAEDFLKSTASQLTYYGLGALHSILNPNDLGILFRNNHFSTVFKHPTNNRLYTLVTDSGYLNHKEVVWETLDNIEGAGHYCDSNFKFTEEASNEATISNQDVHENEYLACLLFCKD